MAAASELRLLVLPGDGIGPEIVGETLRVVDWMQAHRGLRLRIDQALAGGAARPCMEPSTTTAAMKLERRDIGTPWSRVLAGVWS